MLVKVKNQYTFYTSMLYVEHFCFFLYSSTFKYIFGCNKILNELCVLDKLLHVYVGCARLLGSLQSWIQSSFLNVYIKTICLLREILLDIEYWSIGGGYYKQFNFNYAILSKSTVIIMSSKW